MQRKPNIALAKKKLHWKPKINLNEGLELTIEYFKRVLNDSNLKTLAIEINIRTKKDTELLKVIEGCNFIKVDGYKNKNE